MATRSTPAKVAPAGRGYRCCSAVCVSISIAPAHIANEALRDGCGGLSHSCSDPGASSVEEEEEAEDEEDEDEVLSLFLITYSTNASNDKGLCLVFVFVAVVVFVFVAFAVFVFVSVAVFVRGGGGCMG